MTTDGCFESCLAICGSEGVEYTDAWFSCLARECSNCEADFFTLLETFRARLPLLIEDLMEILGTDGSLVITMLTLWLPVILEEID